jgi:hypothetical protein
LFSWKKYSITMMRIALAVVYIWFWGFENFRMSPAGELVEETGIGFNQKYLFRF